MTAPEDVQALVKRMIAKAEDGSCSVGDGERCAPLLREAADALATALRERDTLAARVKELEYLASALQPTPPETP